MKLSISMTRRETLLGWSYLLISMFVLPFALSFINHQLRNPLSETELNLFFFAVNFIAVIIIFRRFLAASFKALLETPWRWLRYAFYGFSFYYLSLFLLSKVTNLIYPDFSNVNDEAVIGLFQEHSAMMTIATVFLAPFTEELLYRGLLFQSFQRKNRLLAYCLSVGVFAAIHVMGYIGRYDFLTLILCYIQYLPAGIALAWAYEKSDTIAAPILIHITINQLGTAAMR